MRNFKIIASVILIVALLLSFSVSSFAIGEEFIIGGIIDGFLSAAGISASVSGLGASAFNSWMTTSTNIDPQVFYGLPLKVFLQTSPITGAQKLFIAGASALAALTDGADYFVNAESLVSDSQKTISLSYGNYNGCPFTQTGNLRKGDLFWTPTAPGTSLSGVVSKYGFLITFTPEDSRYFDVSIVAPAGEVKTINHYDSHYTLWIGVVSNSGLPYLRHSTSYQGNSGSVALDSSLLDLNSSSVSVTTGTINTVPTDDALSITVPAGTFSGISDGEYTDFDTQADILEILNTIAAQNQLVQSMWDTYPDVPVPPTPIPVDVPLGEIPVEDWMDLYGSDVLQGLEDVETVIDTYGQSAVEAIENQTDVIDTFGQEAIEALENQTDVIDTIGQSVTDVLDSIDAGINDVTTGIRTKIDALTDALTDVGTNILEAVKEEILGDLGKLETAFAGVITRLRNAMSIWHYVVEWVGSIGSVFGWIIGFASNTSYYMVLPIYACIAGGIVLGVYRRFGR